ncbi:Pre-rRNA-processing protein TSR2 [Grifola frondosa]|uniref:Pre-rRNA-processing protein TSR2 n=1 Tax=Grifola frondosa TaxID=5627 RepID=A0A1C7LUY7_GRIFR|nr:Pre-rRNA-processing protein TSR2 [Grifola frondosa]
MSESPAPSTSAPPTLVLFARGVIARLAYWPALRIAVDQGWGGPESAQKRTWLASVLVDAFEGAEPLPDAEYVELALLQAMEDEFDAVIEDGSAEAVATDVLKVWDAACAGRVDIVISFEEQADRLKGKKVQYEEAAADEDDWEDESEEESEGEAAAEEAPTLLDHKQKAKEEPEIDEDGFTTVKGKGRNHR